jgi:uncharacterized membrane protein YoaK (UPF0700 family)
LSARVRDALLLTLTAAAGSADAVSYLGLGRVFTANMTGNLVLFGVAIGQGQLAGSVRSVIAFAAFVAGVLAGWRVTAAAEPTAVWPRSVTLAVVAELGLLLAFFGGWEVFGARPATLALVVLVMLSAGAMGMQSAAARRLGVSGVTTTFVTGTLTSLLTGFATVPGRAERTLWFATLGCLVMGAAAGALVFALWRAGAPLVATGFVTIVLAAAIWGARQGE